MTPSNGGQESTTTYSDLKAKLADYYSGNLANAKYKQHRAAIESYAGKKAVDVLHYAAQDVTLPDGSIYKFPEITFYGYTPEERVLLDSFVDGLINELETNPTFRANEAMAKFEKTGNESLVSMRASTSPGGQTRGVTPMGSSRTTDAVNSIVYVGDINGWFFSDNVTSERGKAELLIRVFHEMVHETSRHYENVYDESKTFIQNLNAPPFTADEVIARDLAYRAPIEVLPLLSARTGVAGDLIRTLGKEKYAESIRQTYQDKFDLEIRLRVKNRLAKPNTSPDRFQPDELKILLSKQLIRLKKQPSGDTRTAQEYRDDPTSYELARKTVTTIKELQEKLASVTTVESGGLFDTLEGAADAGLEMAHDFFAQFAGEIGQAFGSTLGRQLVKSDNAFAQVGVSTLVGVLGQNVGEEIEQALRGTRKDLGTSEGFENLGEDLRNAGIGMVSSFLTAELFEELGLTGTLAELGQSVFASGLTQIATAIANGAEFSAELFTNLQFGNLIGGYIGTRLASELVEFDTVAGQVGAAIGTAIGAAVGAKYGATIGGAWGGPIGAAIGAFIGYIVGGFIGSIFGTPARSGADVGWHEGARRFLVSNPWAKGGASMEGAQSFASSAADVLNTVLRLSGSKVLEGDRLALGMFGTFKKDFVFMTNDSTGKMITAFKAREANLVINYGVALSLSKILPHLGGGDVHVKRAVIASMDLVGFNIETIPAVGEDIVAQSNAMIIALNFDMNVLLGNMAVAKDYTAYLQNRDEIDLLRAAEPNSAFAAGWTITLLRAYEIGLMRRSIADWVGGWGLFLDERPDGLVNGLGYSGAQVAFVLDGLRSERLTIFIDARGDAIDVIGDSIDSAEKDIVMGTSGADTITVSGATLVNPTSLTINGQAGPQFGYTILIAATINGGAGDDVIIGGRIGNDLVGGDGNDTLVGGKLDDWLFGEAGNDRLFAGASNYSFTDGDMTATSIALDVQGNGDMLDGGEGDDVLYGSNGSDYLNGGAGVDRIFGGKGGDIIVGGAGNEGGPGNAPNLFGGDGADQYVFGYGDGVDVILDEADGTGIAGTTGDSIRTLIQNTDGLHPTFANWTGGGTYETDGSIKGGEDAISFGPGITIQDILLQRTGTQNNKGQDLIIKLTWEDPATGIRSLTGDQVIVRDFFESTRRIEWLRFANGDEMRIGSLMRMTGGTPASDLIIGTGGGDFLNGGDGDDRIYGLGGDDYGFGGAGNDFVSGDADQDFVSGGAGDDSVIGGSGHDTIMGDAGNDTLYGGAGVDTLFGGRGDDIIVTGTENDYVHFDRGDGRDIVMDDHVNNWEVVWVDGVYQNGYALDAPTGTVQKNGVVVFDSTKWIGVYDYDEFTKTLSRNLGELNGRVAAKTSGNNWLEFGVGIDFQDVMIRRTGGDLELAIGTENSMTSFEDTLDRITLKEWYLDSRPFGNFVFASTGSRSLSGMTLPGLATDGADTLTGTTGRDWITGNGGDDIIDGGDSEDIIMGNAGNDTLYGGAAGDVLFGGAGDDILDAGLGTGEMLFGGDGFDFISFSGSSAYCYFDLPFLSNTNALFIQHSSIEGLQGSNNGDQLAGDAGANVLRGRKGSDALNGTLGDDIYEFELGDGQDTVHDVRRSFTVLVDAAQVFNSAEFTAVWTYLGYLPTANGDRYAYELVITENATGGEVYRSRAGVDFLYTTGPALPLPDPSTWPRTNAQIIGAFGNYGNYFGRINHLSGDAGRDTIDFGLGVSLSDLSFTRPNGGADLYITYSATTDMVKITNQVNPDRAIETIQFRDGLTVDLRNLRLLGEAATADNDLMFGDRFGNTLNGLAGNDALSGGDGIDTLLGGEGDDALEGGLAGDNLNGGNDSVTAGVPLDTTDQTRVYGDTIRYVTSNAGVVIDLAALTASGGHATGDIIVAENGVSTIENIVGTQNHGDTLGGDARANRILGLGGNDTIEGRGGNDVLIGGLGDDLVRGGDGEDNIAGEAGADTLEGGADKDLIAGGDGDDSLTGDAGADMLTGGAGNDIVSGGADDDKVAGDAGNDYVYGDAGNDAVAGGEGNDFLFGGDGNDTLAGETGDDQLSGGAGEDIYAFDANSGSDTIVDAEGRNRIAISGVTRDKVWITRSGNELIIGVIGGTAQIVVQNYYGPTGASVVKEVLVEGSTLFLAYSEQLIQAMTSASATTPAQMPSNVAAMLGSYWVDGGTAIPEVAGQSLTTDEDVPLSGMVIVQDRDDDIVSYAVEADPIHGTVGLNTTTGAWTYTPDANYHGDDFFLVTVTDAKGHASTATINVALTSINDAPSDISLSGAPAGIDERDHPISGTVLTAVELGTLIATDVDAPDSGDFATHVFAVSDSRFEVVNGTTLRLKAGVALDFEAGSTVSVDVTVTDRAGQGLSYTKTLTFAVNDLDDYFYGTGDGETITGQSGRNIIYGHGGDDILNGQNANDLLDGGDGADQLFGNGGNDTLQGYLGDDVLEGGAGNDTLQAGDGTDTLRGGDGEDQLFGESGNDLLLGGNDNDQLDGGADDDTLEGEAGNDRLVGNSGDDLLIGGAGADRFLGGAGYDTVSYASASSAVTVNLATGTGSGGDAEGDIFEDTPERLIGTAYDDSLTGSAGDEVIEGGSGNDTLYGGAGNDVIRGGDGNDFIDAQAGDDTIYGGAGNDILNGGDGHDTYRMDLSSGADEIRNFDPNGTDIDVVGYAGITKDQLWFAQSGNDLVVTVVGTDVVTTIKNWYVIADANDRANYKIDFFIAGEYVTKTVNAEWLVDVMDGYTQPTTQAEYDALQANPTFDQQLEQAWTPNAAPTVTDVATQTINEDGTLTLSLSFSDDFTPAAGLAVTVTAVRVDDHNVQDLSIVNAPTVGAPNGAGVRGLTVNAKPNASGQVAIKVRAEDAGGIATEKVFLLNVLPVVDAPTLSLGAAPTPPGGLGKLTFDGGNTIAVNLNAALTDQDGSETLEIRISNVPSSLSFNSGTPLGGGVWSFTQAQLTNLRLSGPASWYQDLTGGAQLTITAISRETATGATSSVSSTLALVINARPTDVFEDRTLYFSENLGATGLAWMLSSDNDAGDSATYSLIGDPSNAFHIAANGLLSSTRNFDYETQSSYSFTVQITDSGGLTRAETFNVNVYNAAERPTDIYADRTLEFYENYGAGTGLAWFGRVDPDGAGDGATYSLVGDGAGGRYAVRSDGLLMTGSTLIDRETGGAAHNITVRVTDSAGLTFDEVFTVGVLNINEAPTITTTSLAFYENTGGPGIPLQTFMGLPGRIVGTDPENVPLSYQFVGGATNIFSIDASGQIYSHSLLDYETSNMFGYDMTVRAWDGGAVGLGNYVDKTVNLGLIGVSEGPKITQITRTTATPTASPYPWIETWYETNIGFMAQDPEGHQIVSAAIVAIEDPYGWSELDLVYSITLGDLWGTPEIETGFMTYRNGWIGHIARVRLTDHWGFTADTLIDIQRYTTGFVIVGPVVLDVDGDGLSLVSTQSSTVRFDMDGDGTKDQTGWTSPGDAFLALDRNGDGLITTGAEISFTQDLEGARSDLEGLSVFDTDANGYFDVTDERFAEFKVWQDANQDGVSQASELRTLAEHDIKAINLTRTATGFTVNENTTDNVIVASSEFVRTDGSMGIVGDVSMGYLTEGMPATIIPDDLEWRDPDYGPGGASGDELKRAANKAALALGALGDAQSTDDRAPEAADLEVTKARTRPYMGDSQGDLLDAQREERERALAAYRRDQQWADSRDRFARNPGELWEPAAQPIAPGALHASLDLVARRRLQMVEAMASFDVEGASRLELRPQRHVDSRTYELLTAVSLPRNVA